MAYANLVEVTLPSIDIPTSENLPTEDGVPLESSWHRAAINLLLDNLTYYWREGQDYYAGGNMFVYFSMQQVRNQDYRGPDFFIVKEVDGSYDRQAWVVWEENGRYPDLIIELLSPTTAEADKTSKKRLYERVFRTTEYYCYDPATQELLGWHLQNNHYEPLLADENGRLWSAVVQAWLGPWLGTYLGHQAIWLRFFDEDTFLIPTIAEAALIQANEETARADEEAARANEEAARANEEAARADEEAARADEEAARADEEAARANQEAARANQEAARANQEADARRAAEVEVARLQELLARLQG